MLCCAVHWCVSPLCPPPQECSGSAGQVKAGGSKGRPGGRTQTQTEPLEMLLFCFLSLSFSLSLSSLCHVFCFVTVLPPRLFHGRKPVYLWKEIKKRRKCFAFYFCFPSGLLFSHASHPPWSRSSHFYCLLIPFFSILSPVCYGCSDSITTVNDNLTVWGWS